MVFHASEVVDQTEKLVARGRHHMRLGNSHRLDGTGRVVQQVTLTNGKVEDAFQEVDLTLQPLRSPQFGLSLGKPAFTV